jgi:YD repeat-containing protein
MALSVLLMALAGLVLVAFAVRFVRAKWKHDPVEYYMGWGGTRHPITPQNRITREEAQALAARGAAYLIAYYADDGRLTRAVKLDRGEFFFEYRYTYHPNGRLKRVRVTRGGCVTVLDYDIRGRRFSDASVAF